MTQQNSREQCQDILSKLKEEIFKKIEEIRISITGKNSFDEHIQEELSKQITLLQHFEGYIVRKNNKLCENLTECNNLKSKFHYLQLAFDTLLSERKEIVIAKRIRYDCEYFLNSKKFLGGVKTFFQQATRDFVTPTKVLLGLAMAIPIYGVGIPLFLTSATILTTIPDIIEYEGKMQIKPSNTEQQKAQRIEKIINKLKDLSENSSLLIMVASAGAFGSIVSIFIRLDQYEGQKPKSSATPILVGFAKPLIGTAFGILIFTMINSNIVSFPFLQGSKNSTSSSTTTNVENNSVIEDNTVNVKYYLFFTLAFLVGFSERLAKDIVKLAEDQLSPQEFGEKVDKVGEKVDEAGEKVVEKVDETGQEIKDEVHSIHR